MAKKAKTSKTFRTTLSIPTNLKLRMDQVGTDVNWSAVASRAFEEKLAEIASEKQKKSNEGVIQRLRASQIIAQGGDYGEGSEAGTRWVDNEAEVTQLNQLQKWKSECQPNWEEIFEEHPNRQCSIPQLIYEAIRPDEKGRTVAADEYWRGVFGNQHKRKMECLPFLKGFVEGVFFRWNELKELL